MHPLLERNDRDAEAGGVDEVVLEGILELGVATRSRGATSLQSEDAMRVVVGRISAAAGDHEQLPELLVDRHPTEQVPHAHFYRQSRILVRLLRPRTGGQQDGGA